MKKLFEFWFPADLNRNAIPKSRRCVEIPRGFYSGERQIAFSLGEDVAPPNGGYPLQGYPARTRESRSRLELARGVLNLSILKQVSPSWEAKS
jgi:hypothetical protein